MGSNGKGSSLHFDVNGRLEEHVLCRMTGREGRLWGVKVMGIEGFAHLLQSALTASVILNEL